MKQLCFVFILAILALSGCNSNAADQENEIIYQRILKYSGKELSKYKAVFILPSQGCGNCITNAETYFIEKYLPNKKHKLLYIITGLSSRKSAITRFGKDAVNSPDVHLDINHNFDKPPFMVEYPKIVFLENSKVSSISDINPETSEKIYQQIQLLN